MSVSSKADGSSSSGFDSMYNPLQEEYLVVSPQNVLPEFLVQYKRAGEGLNFST